MSVKLFDSELKVMDVLWKEGDMTAKQISNRLKERIGWNVNTTYTVIKKCIDKGAVIRTEPGFICKAAVSRNEVCENEAFELIDRLFGGSPDLLVSALIGSGKISPEELKKLRETVRSMEEE